MGERVTIDAWSCPLPLRDHPAIVMGHGGGGKLSAELVEHLFAPAFGTGSEDQGPDITSDAAVLAGSARIVVSTDSFVVRPRFFPGGNIGELAVHGTINDVAMRGAVPRHLAVSFVLEEGLPMNELGAIAESMGQAARAAGVRIVTGDTKVVDRGHGDGVYITTTGIGELADGVEISPNRITVGDAILVSGTIGDHGMAIMSVREGLEFGSSIESDTAALHGLVADLLATGIDVHALRDPTRGGLAASLNEMAVTAGVGISIDDGAVPVARPVRSACEMLGMDPFYVANEGKLVAIVPAGQTDAALATMRSNPLAAEAAVVGEVVAAHPGMVVARTAFGSTRVVDTQIGEQLPRIC
jgi:hydrogenase expression/formation protein HypE